jgi:antitoxin HigA-1
MALTTWRLLIIIERNCDMNGMRPIHPGEVLKDELAEIGMTANAFAHALHVPANRITAILNGNRSVTADTALRISRFFGTTPEFWLNLQTAYDLKIAKLTVGNKVEQEVRSFLPTMPRLLHANHVG